MEQKFGDPNKDDLDEVLKFFSEENPDDLKSLTDEQVAKLNDLHLKMQNASQRRVEIVKENKTPAQIIIEEIPPTKNVA
jgi:hypothetical protein